MKAMPCMLLVSALAGCSTSAIIQRTDGTTVEGPIVGGDHAVLLVADGAETLRIERSTIVDIDHPGNVALTLGVIATAFTSLPFIGAMSSLTRDTRPSDWIPGLSLFGIFGSWAIPTIVWGATTWQESTLRARPGPPPVTIRVHPTGVLVTF